MSEDRNGADLEFKVVGQEFNAKNIKSLNTVATIATLVAVVATSVFMWQHDAQADKTSSAILQEIKDNNQKTLQTQKNVAFFSCMQACYLEQTPEKRNSAACERQCAPVRQ